MNDCPRFLVPFGAQLGAGPTGPVDCTAWAASRVVGQLTCGARLPTGRRIRQMTDEPIPDPASPGLNLTQVHDVLWDHYNLWTDVRTGRNALTWAEYERLRRDGRPMVVQLDYSAIADSRFDAGRGFRGGHAIFESISQTIDSLADGRARNVYDYEAVRPRLYPRALIRAAAGELVVDVDIRKGPVTVGDGRVWALVGVDRTPEFRARIKPRRRTGRRKVRVYHFAAGHIIGYEVATIRDLLDVPCSAPRGFLWPSSGGARRFLVRIVNPRGRLHGKWIHAHWADPQYEADTGGDESLEQDAQLELDDPDETVAEVRSEPYVPLDDDPTGDDL